MVDGHAAGAWFGEERDPQIDWRSGIEVHSDSDAGEEEIYQSSGKRAEAEQAGLESILAQRTQLSGWVWPIKCSFIRGSTLVKIFPRWESFRSSAQSMQ